VRKRSRAAGALLVVILACPRPATADGPIASSDETRAWFQKTEQALMDAIAVGDKAAWDRLLAPEFVLTSEEGDVTPRARLLEDLRGLPPGLEGRITVRELTVQEYPEFAIVRYLADEWESVFGQVLTPKYRATNVYRRDGSDWKLAASHLSVVTADPPAQKVSTACWPSYVGRYRLLPDGWMLTVELQEGRLLAGRDPSKLRPLVPLTPDAFVQSGSLGEWIFVSDEAQRVTHVLNLRKFAVLVWTRVDGAPTRNP
jgi:hypothetical protein